MDIGITTASSISEVDSSAWDQLGEGLPFQSHRWYALGELVMDDCAPVYLLAYDGNEMVARASFWLVKNEPLPGLSIPVRTLADLLIRRWPLFICRSPLANTTGLILPRGSKREAVLTALSETAMAEAKSREASFVLFDYLYREDTLEWPNIFTTVKVSNPGTIMQNRWESLEGFLADGNKKDRQHYKRTIRKAEKMGLRLEKHKQVPDLDGALRLIRMVDRRYGNAPSPWVGNLLSRMDEVDGTWLEARIDGELVGCGLILEDNEAQMTTALGLAEDVPFVYFLLVYACLEVAFEKKVRLLRWGSGAYEAKKKLGFSLEHNNHTAIRSTFSLLNNLMTHLLPA